MPEGAVYVGRGSRWGNPFRVGDPGTPDAATAVRQFEEALTGGGEMSLRCGLEMAAIHTQINELCGRDLACWCAPGEPCHADVLLRLANEPGEGKEDAT